MHRQFVKWWSPSLGRDMEMLIFGHAGTPVLVFPSSNGRYYEWEDFKMIEAVRDKVESGQNQFYCLDSVDAESFYNRGVHPHVRFARYEQYERYVLDEVVPLIHNNNPNRYIIVSGASFGAYHAANFGLKHPWTFRKIIAMSGKYDIRAFADGHNGDNVYFNNPVDFMPNMHNHDHLEQIRRNDLRFVVGDHDICLDATKHFCHILYQKGIWYELDVWSPGIIHDWPAWRGMIAKHLL
ncbi:MAG: esterase [Candidatus Cyclonatronum sp.]|uniref:esterase family protein n=1 Tax=Cyclonatronum sp. TaxID=3024185 RepID=UPI0025C4F96E|nr:alpha/beta hydrolase-fold protein [Cyclonatronum sp.]MCC5934119.1 esterase family protein [Balneolales bacterium]MCH8487108.1 esterase [Cyclonatronum sp.]